MYSIRVTKEFGRGLYATEKLYQGDVLFKAELIVLSEKDTEQVNKTDLRYYTFKYNETQDCLVLGNAELFNHSDNPNVGYGLVRKSDGRHVMIFTLLRDVEHNEQLFIDYNLDTRVNVDAYKVNLVG